MKFRFSVTAFINRRTRLGVVGSIAELGLWNAESCVPLLPLYVNIDENEPSMWSTVINIDVGSLGENTKDIEYKFICWTVDEELQASSDGHFPLEDDLVFPSAPEQSCTFLPPDAEASLIWEGSGSDENRALTFRQDADKDYTVTPHSLIRLFTPDVDMLDEKVYTLPVYQFRDPHMQLSEYSHTTRSYLRIKDSLSIHYNRILNRVIVGTCPLKKEHVMNLMEKENVSDIINLQDVHDIENNFLIENTTVKTPEALSEFYDSLGLRYIWFPMEDMSSSARARGLAQTAVLLGALLKRKDCTGVYVHCNAGVGRSTACVAGYIHCVLGVSLRMTNILMNARRPVAYFDESALQKAAKDFEFKFSGIVDALRKTSEGRAVHKQHPNKHRQHEKETEHVASAQPPKELSAQPPKELSSQPPKELSAQAHVPPPQNNLKNSLDLGVE